MSTEELSARLEQLERDNRRMKAGGAAALLVVAALAVMGQATPSAEVLRARSFEVVDLEGRALVSLGSDERMRSALKFFAEDGSPQVVLGASRGGGGLLGFLDGDREPSMTLTSHPAKGVALILADAPKGHRAALTAAKKTACLLVGDELVTASLSASAGNGEFCISGPENKLSASVTRFRNGDACLKLWDKDGRLFHCVPEGSHPESDPK